MQGFLRLSHWLDRLGYRCGQVANVMILVSCFVSASNAMVRYGFNWSSNAFLEMQWQLFAAAVMLGASYTFQRNEHVRVDLIYGHVSERKQMMIDIFGIIFFLFPACILFTWLSWEALFLPSLARWEGSGNSGGLPLWPIKIIVPVGFALLTLQGVSELIKRIAHLFGKAELDSRYERPVQ
ncbi:TRAP transporter small permease subunit [Pseudoduganella violaceinigra]|uniref:TRAP transporter small permease subunit n=1 Tax=Pseudoduganella violaceinigra TaxID=246602 RepID=UPI00040603C2|nr:TRAP transporter small permease subunit [Pseudoduganella violaceinigra]